MLFAPSYSFLFARWAWVASIQSSNLAAAQRFTSLQLHTAQRLPKCCRSSEEEARWTKRAQEQQPAEKTCFVSWRRHSQAFAHLLNVKGEQSSERLKCKGWESCTSLPWEKAHLSWVSHLYAPGYQGSNTLSTKRRERSRGLCVFGAKEGAEEGV